MYRIIISADLEKQFPEVYSAIETLNPETIESENIWLRDFMPVEGKSSLVKFSYDAVGGGEPGKIELNGAIQSGIWLDGGNLQNVCDHWFVTDIVLEHNPHLSRKEIISSLSDLLGSDVTIIPNDADDFYGHSDGIIAGVPNKNFAFVSESASHKNIIFNELDRLKIESEILPCPREKIPYEDSLSAFGYYINFLAIGTTVLFPAFGISEDDEARKLFEKHFEKALAVPCRKISMRGGCVHCVTADYQHLDPF